MDKQRVKKIIPYLYITFGVLLTSLSYYYFLSPSFLVIGGVMGLSIVFKEIISPTLFLYFFNILFLFLGLIVLGKKFFYKTIFGTLISPTFIFIFSLLPFDENIIINQISDNSNLIVVTIASSILMGIGMGIVIRNGATTGGMDVIQKILSKKLKLPFSFVMYITDGIVILIGLYAFGLEKAFFAIFIMIFSGYIIDRICIGGVHKRAAYIITTKPDEIIQAIYKEINRGVTKSICYGGYTNLVKTQIVCIMSQNEYFRLRLLIEEIDPNAFMYIVKTNEVLGEGFGYVVKE